MQHELMIPRACDVVEVAIEDGTGGECTLVVRSVGRRGEHERRMQAPRPTVQHAAAALARHYGLARDDHRRWSTTAASTQAPPLAG